MKMLGERSLGNPDATFDEAGDGNVIGSIRAPLFDPILEGLPLVTVAAE